MRLSARRFLAGDGHPPGQGEAGGAMAERRRTVEGVEVRFYVF